MQLELQYYYKICNQYCSIITRYAIALLTILMKVDLSTLKKFNAVNPPSCSIIDRTKIKRGLYFFKIPPPPPKKKNRVPAVLGFFKVQNTEYVWDKMKVALLNFYQSFENNI